MVDKLQAQIIIALTQGRLSINGIKMVCNSDLGQIRSALDILETKRVLFRKIVNRKVYYYLNELVNENYVIELTSPVLETYEVAEITDKLKPIITDMGKINKEAGDILDATPK